MDVVVGPPFWLLDTVIGLYIWILIAGAVLSWLVAFNVVNTRNRFVYLVGDFLHRITEPALRPIRRVLPNLGGIDLSPLVLILLLLFLRQVLARLYVAYATGASKKRAEAALPFAQSADGLLVRLRVTPRSRRPGFGGMVAAGGHVCLKVSVSEAPEDGRANSAVLALLAREWRLPRSSLSIKAGGADRRKIVAVAGDPDELMSALLSWLTKQG